MDDREWKTQENIDEMLRDPDEIAVDIEKAVYMWPGIEAEFLAEDESEQAENEEDNDPELMFHRIGLRVGAMISEREFERALLFCGTGMGIHIAASKCPHVHAGVVESVPAALRAVTGNGVNVLAMGAFYVAPQMGCDIADTYLGAELGTGYEWWENFYEFHKLAIDELEAFNYEEYKKNGFHVKQLGNYDLKLESKPD